MADTTYTFRVEQDLKNEFIAAAKSCERTGAQLLRSFMRDFVKREQARRAANHDAWFYQQVQMSLAAANAGDSLSAEEVEAEASDWRAGIRHKLKSDG